jgi:hypothetical protein
VIDELLLDLGLTVKQRDGGWAVSPAQCDVVVRQAGDEVRVEATLATWDEIGAEEERALAAFLRRAEAELPFAT